MTKIIRFPLIMRNGAEVRTLEELKDNFDLNAIIGYFSEGKLEIWLRHRYYNEMADSISELSKEDAELAKKICDVLNVDFKEQAFLEDIDIIEERNIKKRILQNTVDDPNIIANIDNVAFNQKELEKIIENGGQTIYLYSEQFRIPFRENIVYIGINKPTATIETGLTLKDYNDKNIKFHDIYFGSVNNPYYLLEEWNYICGNYEDALPVLKQTAMTGNPRAKYMISMCFYQGAGVHVDKNKCMEWVADINNFEEPLAVISYARWGCSEDSEKKERINKCIEKLIFQADEGDALAQYEYGLYLIENNEDKEIGIKYLELSSANGYVMASVYLGYCLYSGNLSEKNVDKALDLFILGYEHGIPSAMNQIGYMMLMGETNERVSGKSVDYFEKAANLDYSAAQYNLGYLYYIGNGVTQNYSIAVKWFQLAAAHNHPDAIFFLAQCYLYGDGGLEKDAKKANDLLVKASDLGNMKAKMQIDDHSKEGNQLPNKVVNYIKSEDSSDSYKEVMFDRAYISNEMVKFVSWYIGSNGTVSGGYKKINKDEDNEFINGLVNYIKSQYPNDVTVDIPYPEYKILEYVSDFDVSANFIGFISYFFDSEDIIKRIRKIRSTFTVEYDIIIG